MATNDSREAYAVFQQEGEEWEQRTHWDVKEKALEYLSRYTARSPQGRFFVLCKVESSQSMWHAA